MRKVNVFRRPDNVVWYWKKWYWGIRKQQYSFDAMCLTVCIGPLTLRWHER